MKKILALILVMCLAMAFMSCGKDDENEGNGDNNDGAGNVTGGVTDVTAFTNAIANTNPDGAVINVKTETALGELNAKYVVAYNEDGSAVVNYTVEQFNEFDIENPEADKKSEITGTATINADGTCTGIDANVASIAAGTAIDLTAVAANATINEAGDILTVVIPAASTNSVLGISVASDVTLVVSISSTGVDSITITYTGASITCKYN